MGRLQRILEWEISMARKNVVNSLPDIVKGYMDIEIKGTGSDVVTEVTVMLPASKSLSARALLISEMASCREMVAGEAQCDDTAALGGGLGMTRGTVNVGAAGTAMRFLTAYYAATAGTTILIDGSERMRQRPIAPLVDALRQAGAAVEYAGREGYPPLAISGRQLAPINVTMRGDVSSQFVSAMMMIAPRCGGGTLRLTTPLTSRPYVDMTAAVMEHFGARVTVHDDRIVISPNAYRPAPMVIEADWSAASYWYALTAVLPGLTVRLPGLTRDSLQGDRRVVDIMRHLGVATEVNDSVVTLTHREPQLCCSCPHAFYADLADVPDLAQTIVVTLCLLERAFRVTGLHTLRVKETDRIDALRRELAKFGYALQTGTDSIAWHGQRCPAERLPHIDTHDDHRMAMAMAVAAIVRGGAVIEHAEVVTKSYPDFWRHLAEIQPK